MAPRLVICTPGSKSELFSLGVVSDVVFLVKAVVPELPQQFANRLGCYPGLSPERLADRTAL